MAGPLALKNLLLSPPSPLGWAGQTNGPLALVACIKNHALASIAPSERRGSRKGPFLGAERRTAIHAPAKSFQFGLGLRTMDVSEPLPPFGQGPRAQQALRTCTLASRSARPGPIGRVRHQLRTQGISNTVVFRKSDTVRRAEGPAICPAQASGLGIKVAVGREG